MQATPILIGAVVGIGMYIYSNAHVIRRFFSKPMTNTSVNTTHDQHNYDSGPPTTLHTTNTLHHRHSHDPDPSIRVVNTSLSTSPHDQDNHISGSPALHTTNASHHQDNHVPNSSNRGDDEQRVGEIDVYVDVDLNVERDRRGYKGNFSYPVRPKDGLDEDGDNNGGYNGNFSYSARPDAEDCQYYMRTGLCKLGSSCKSYHPLNRRTQRKKSGFQKPDNRDEYLKAVKDKEDYSEIPAKTECKYYMAPGGCNHGEACRFSHIRVIAPTSRAVEFNFLGLPIRPGETECSYYMHNGSCKSGPSCKFNHPEPTPVVFNSSPVPPQANVPLWTSPSAVNDPVYDSQTNGVSAPDLEWNNYQASVYPATEMKLPTPPAFTLNNPTETNFSINHKPPMLVSEFPERPGKPKCNYFMKTGDCKYGSGCKFHHPKNRMPKSAPFTLSDKGLPLRPVCLDYTRYGLCKYGSACRYDHRTHHADSASSTVSDKTNLRSSAAQQ